MQWKRQRDAKYLIISQTHTLASSHTHHHFKWFRKNGTYYTNGTGILQCINFCFTSKGDRWMNTNFYRKDSWQCFCRNDRSNFIVYLSWNNIYDMMLLFFTGTVLHITKASSFCYWFLSFLKYSDNNNQRQSHKSNFINFVNAAQRPWKSTVTTGTWHSLRNADAGWSRNCHEQ